jgi:hypothetical protein
MRSCLPVGSADLTAWVGSLSDIEPSELFVEIRLDRKRVQATKEVERDDTVFWNEEVILCVYMHPDRQSANRTAFNRAGNNSSIVSLSIVHKASNLGTQGSAIGYVDISIGTLLGRCANNECTLDACRLIEDISYPFHSYCSRNDVGSCRREPADDGGNHSKDQRTGWSR